MIQLGQMLIYLFFGYGLAAFFEVVTKKWAMWDKKIGWQIHHSVIGLVLMLLSIFLPEIRSELIFTGLGIIFQHSFGPDGFVFIKRWEK